MDTTERKFLVSQTLYSLVIAKCEAYKMIPGMNFIENNVELLIPAAFKIADAIIQFDKDYPLDKMNVFNSNSPVDTSKLV